MVDWAPLALLRQVPQLARPLAAEVAAEVAVDEGLAVVVEDPLAAEVVAAALVIP
jgi:hypothetical protein